MKALVLGGTRYAGIHLVQALLKGGHGVTIATRGLTPDPFKDFVSRKIIDRQNPDSLQAAFQGEAFDVVIDNLAYSSNEIRYLLDAVHTEKYVVTSSVSVYTDWHMNLQEAEVDTHRTPLKWCGRDDDTYDEIKRQAESALFQAYAGLPSVAVRFPWIFGKDDYSGRLYFYVEHICKGLAMHINNPDARLAFIHSVEAGRFLAWCAEDPFTGAVNAGSHGTISLAEVIAYTEKRCGKKALIDAQGAPAPLNDAPSFSLNTEKAQKAGFSFQSISDWIYETIDFWIDALCTQ